MDCSMPRFLVHPQLQELSQTHVHWVNDAIQPSLPLSSPSPPAFNLSQYQSFFQWVSSSHQMAKVLELQLQHTSFQWIYSIDFLYDWLVLSPGTVSLLEGLSRVFSHPAIQKHQLFGTQTYLWSSSHILTWTLEKPQLSLYRHLSANWCPCFLICWGASIF